MVCPVCQINQPGCTKRTTTHVRHGCVHCYTCTQLKRFFSHVKAASSLGCSGIVTLSVVPESGGGGWGSRLNITP